MDKLKTVVPMCAKEITNVASIPVLYGLGINGLSRSSLDSSISSRDKFISLIDSFGCVVNPYKESSDIPKYRVKERLTNPINIEANITNHPMDDTVPMNKAIAITKVNPIP